MKKPEDFSLDTQLQNMAECLGPFPKQFLDSCSRRAEFFDEEGERKSYPIRR
jgi:hypothetical protein